MKKFEGKVAMITGGSSGIGLASAKMLAEQGSSIMIVDFDAQGGHEAVKEIEKAGGKAAFVKCDVSKAEDCRNAVAQTVKQFGSIDIAFNNAGIGGPQASVADYPVDGWDKIISVNLSGVWYCMKYEIQEMLKKKSG